ncbi:MAG: hypothetical protein ACI81V_000797 [Lentimonas sp.]
MTTDATGERICGRWFIGVTTDATGERICGGWFIGVTTDATEERICGGWFIGVTTDATGFMLMPHSRFLLGVGRLAPGVRILDHLRTDITRALP